jgi:hypothetical protein
MGSNKAMGNREFAFLNLSKSHNYFADLLIGTGIWKFYLMEKLNCKRLVRKIQPDPEDLMENILFYTLLLHKKPITY